MLIAIHPKLPMCDKSVTLNYYVNQLGFEITGGDYPDYLMLKKEGIELHFFLFPGLNPLENYGQVYVRTNDIETLYKNLKESHVKIHPNGALSQKPWGIKEFSLLDPDHNLLTFGESL